MCFTLRIALSASMRPFFTPRHPPRTRSVLCRLSGFLPSSQKFLPVRFSFGQSSFEIKQKPFDVLNSSYWNPHLYSGRACDPVPELHQNLANSRKRFIYRLIADWLKCKIWIIESNMEIKMCDSLMAVVLSVELFCP